MKKLKMSLFAVATLASSYMFAQTETRSIVTEGYQTLTPDAASNIAGTIAENPAPADYAYKCVMNDEFTTFYLLADGGIVKTDHNGETTLVGQKMERPAGRTEFQFMLQIYETGIVYAVDNEGHIWQKKHPFKVIVGQATAKR